MKALCSWWKCDHLNLASLHALRTYDARQLNQAYTVVGHMVITTCSIPSRGSTCSNTPNRFMLQIHVQAIKNILFCHQYELLLNVYHKTNMKVSTTMLC